MEKSVSIDRVFRNVPFYERFALAAAAGFSHVELSRWTELDLTRVGEELRAHGLTLTAISGSDCHDLSNDRSHPDFMEFLSQAIAIAKSFACKGVIIESTTGVSSTPGDCGDTTVIARDDLRNAAIATRVLMAVAQRAQRNGITLHLKPPFPQLEALGFLAALRLSGNVVAAVNSPALRLLLDSTELWKCRNDPDAATIMRRVHPFIGYLHIGERSDAGIWREELAWLKKHLVSFYEITGCIGLFYPATQDDTSILQEFLAF